MGRRGRPKHPDILTPREWEVLALLRDGLSNEQIADRLGVSLAGAKYHVSEILSRLGVSSREEAARWEAERRPWWAVAFAPMTFVWRKASASWAAGTIAVGVFVRIAAGVGVLVWGMVRTSEGSDGVSAIVPTPPSEVGPAPPIRSVSLASGKLITERGVYFVDLQTGAVEGWAGAIAIAVSPNGQFIFYDPQHFFDTQVQATCAAAIDETPNVPQFSEDSRKFVANWEGGVAVFATECGAEPSPLDLPAGAHMESAAWSSDGNRLLLRLREVGSNPNRKDPPYALYLLDIEGREATDLSHGRRRER